MIPFARLGRYELRRFRGVLPRLALVFVLLVPLLYSAIYLSANWDPYGRLDQLPVAVVDEDRPTTVEDSEGHSTRLAAGQDLVDNLLEEPAFDWQVTDAAEAADGLAEGRYFMTMTIPESFSSDLVSGQTPDPRRARIELRRDDANGFVVGSITSKAQDSVELAVDQAAVDAYFSAVFDNLDTIRAGMVDAQDGADKLADGAAKAHEGAGRLASGADQASAGAGDLLDGARSAEAGAGRLATGADELSDGAGRLAAGGSDLAAGARRAQEGAGQLDDGLARLDTGSSTLAEGADQVAAGTAALNAQVLPVLDLVLEELPAVQARAGDISSSVADLTAVVATGSDSLATDVSSLQAQLEQLEGDHPELADDPTWAALTGRVDAASGRVGEASARAQEVAAAAAEIDRAVGSAGDPSGRVQQARTDLVALDGGAHDVASGAHDLHDGIVTAHTGSTALAGGLGDLVDGADQVSAGAGALQTGADQLSSGAHDLQSGLGRLAEGVGTLDEGLTSLADGAHELQTGTGQLEDGADQLASGLAQGVDRMPVLSQDEQDEAAQVMSSPADVRMTVDHPATYYGRGLAPMFFAIALWVFGISVFLVVRPVAGRLLAGRAHPVRLSLTAWFPVAAIAVTAGLIMVAVVWLTLGLDPVRPLSLVALTVLGALCFSSVAHLLRTALGTVASAVTLVWLVLQLPTSGGTYPAELLPSFFAALSPAMPMTYLIDAYRVVISGGQVDHLVRDVLVLAVITVTSMGLCALVILRRQQLRQRDLHPPLVAP